MKQITIYELLPLLRQGFVAMGKSGDWRWFSHKPNVQYGIWSAETLSENITILFNIKPFDGDWKDSLMKCYRFTAVPTPDWQSYAEYKPVNGTCDGFWDNKGYRSRFNTKGSVEKQEK